MTDEVEKMLAFNFQYYFEVKRWKPAMYFLDPEYRFVAL